MPLMRKSDTFPNDSAISYLKFRTLPNLIEAVYSSEVDTYRWYQIGVPANITSLALKNMVLMDALVGFGTAVIPEKKAVASLSCL